MSTTNKNKQKIRRYDALKAQAIIWTAKEFEVTEAYVRMIENNDRLSTGRSEEIRRAYRKKYAELKKVLS